jgi:hypothetical protein
VEVDPDRFRIGRLDGEQRDHGEKKQALHDTSVKR